jgi:hypothetical protein
LNLKRSKCESFYNEIEFWGFLRNQGQSAYVGFKDASSNQMGSAPKHEKSSWFAWSNVLLPQVHTALCTYHLAAISNVQNEEES